MAKNRWTEVENFARMGGRADFGALCMRGDSVYSYDMLIAKVDRDNRRITMNSKKVSKTTTMHQRAVEVAAQHLVDHYRWLRSYDGETWVGL